MQHPRYYSTLRIVRTKIIGSAADILTKHNTKLNFYSIINRLDYTYADQRALYVLLDGMKRIVQGRRTLSEFHSEISKALNLALSKIEMSASQNNAAMLEYANEEAVRTFILGLNSKYTSGTLYSNSPKDLEAAYAIACTIYHDNVNQQFDIQPQRSNPARHHYPENRPAPRYEDRQHRYNPGIQVYGNNQRFQHQQQPQRPVPMEVDNSREFVRTTQNGKYNNPFKRDRVPSNQNVNPQKLQRINHTVEEENRAENLDCFEDKFETGSTFLGV